MKKIILAVSLILGCNKLMATDFKDTPFSQSNNRLSVNKNMAMKEQRGELKVAVTTLQETHAQWLKAHQLTLAAKKLKKDEALIKKLENKELALKNQLAEKSNLVNLKVEEIKPNLNTEAPKQKSYLSNMYNYLSSKASSAFAYIRSFMPIWAS